MARNKKKRLNKRVVIILVLLGLAIVIGGALASSRVRNWLFPKDPTVPAAEATKFAKEARDFVEKAKKLDEEGKREEATALAEKAHEAFDKADKAYQEAFRLAKDAKRKAEYCYLRGKMLLDQVRIKGGLTDTRRRKLTDTGMACLNKALQQDPKHIDSRKLRCDVLWQFARRRAARPGDYIEEAGKLLEMDPNDHLTWFRRGAIRAAQVDIDGEKAIEALADLDKAISLKPDEVGYWSRKAGFQERIKRFEATDETYRKALKVEANADNAALRVAYAWYLRRHNLREEARVQIDRAIKRAPEDTLPLRALARFLRDDQRPDEALSVLEKARKLDPEDHRTYSELAVAYKTMKKPKQALAVLRVGAKTLDELINRPDPSSTRKTQAIRKSARANLHFELANAILASVGIVTDKDERKELLAEARACVKIVRESGGREAICDSLDGQLAYHEGKRNEALTLLEKAYKAFGGQLEPNTASLLIQLYQQVGAPGKAEDILDRFMAMPELRNNVAIRLQKALFEMQRKEWDNANQSLREILRIDAENADAKGMLAIVALNIGGADRLPVGVKPTPQIIRGVLARASALWADEQRSAAMAMVEDIQKRAPDSLTVARQLVSMYQVAKEDEKLEALMKKLETEQPELSKQFKRAQEFLDEKDPEKRLAMLVERTKEIEDELTRELKLADLYRSVKQIKLFLEHLDKAAKIKSDAPGVIMRRFNYAILIKDWDQAQGMIAKAAKANIDGTEGKLLALRLAMVRGKDDVAIKKCDEILAANRNHKQARLIRGELYMRRRDLDKAAEDFQTVASSDPSSAPAAIGMMLVTELQGKPAEFNEWLDRARRLAPQNKEVVRRYTDREEQRASSPEEIIAKREKQLARDPQDLNNRLRLGYLYERTRQMNKAQQMFRSIWSAATNKLYGTQILASFYARNKRLGEADSLIQNLLKTTTDKVTANIMYGQFLAPHKPDQARRAFGNAIKADPDNPAGYHALARFRAQTRRWGDAIQAMLRCVELKPDAPGLEKELISYELNAGSFTDAQNRLDRILSVSPTDAAALRLKARLLLVRDGDTTGAEDLLSKSIRENPSDIRSLLDRAVLYMRIRDLAKAKTDLEQARQIRDSAAIVLDLAGVYVGLKQYSQAENTLKTLLKKNPKSSQAIERLAGVYTVQEKWKDEEDLLATAIKAEPDNARYRIIEAQMWRRREDKDKELAALAAGVKIIPEDVAMVGAYLDGLLNAERYTKLLEVTEPYLTKEKFSPMIEAIRARALAKSGKTPEAEEIFRSLVKKAATRSLGFLATQMVESFGLDKTIAVFPLWRGNSGQWQLHNVMGQLYRRADRTKEAAEALTKARDLTAARSRERGVVNIQLGMALYRMDKLPEAEKAYLAALSVVPNDSGLLNNLAFLYVDDFGQPDKAMPFAEKAYRQAPQNANVVDTYAWVLAKLKKYQQAEKILTSLIDRDSSVPAARLHLGWVLEQQGRLDSAKKQYLLGQEMISDKKRNKKLFDAFAESIKRVQGQLNR